LVRYFQKLGEVDVLPLAHTLARHNEHYIDNRITLIPCPRLLSPARTMLADLMRRVEGFALTDASIALLPVGKRQIYEEGPQGIDRSRYHIILQGLPGSLFTCGDETVTMRTGEVWWLDASAPHHLINNSADDFIHIEADIRVE
jgi:Aspartyl/Asparaginyl beta-hydroxylase